MEEEVVDSKKSSESTKADLPEKTAEEKSESSGRKAINGCGRELPTPTARPRLRALHEHLVGKPN